MRTTIDAAGRIVVPKRLRDQLGFTAGAQLEVTAVDGRLEVSAPDDGAVRLEERDGRLVAVHDGPIEPLTVEQVRDTLEHLRR